MTAEAEAVAALVAHAGLAAGAVAPLGGTRNRLFLCAADGGAVVVRLGRAAEDFAEPGHEIAAMAAAARLGVAPELLWADGVSGAFVVRRAAGRTLGARDLGDAEVLGRVGRALARLHGGEPFPGALDPACALDRYARDLTDAGDLARDGARLWAALGAGRRLAPCHNDPVPANMIDDGARVLLVDWEFAGMNDPAWDLAYVAVEGGLGEAALDRLLAAYGAPDPAPFGARVRACRAMVMLVNGAWDRRHGGAGAALGAARAMMDSATFARQVRVATGEESP